MNNIYTHYFKTPFGELILGDYDNQLCLCDWRFRKMRTSIDNRISIYLSAQFVEKSTNLIELTKLQLNEYFSKKRKLFEIPLLLIGTNFQKQVWEELIKIEYGKTLSYLTLSEKINNVKAIRAVASANGANAISIIIPCHRIIGNNGDLVGYAGGTEAKRKLLQLESASNSEQLPLFLNKHKYFKFKF